jgi:serine/threonine protein kinase
MGRLYLAIDPVLGRRLAIKLIRDGLEDPDARARFMQEARAAGGLKHPNVVTVFDAGDHEGCPFIAMEYVSGDTLTALIQRRAWCRSAPSSDSWRSSAGDSRARTAAGWSTVTSSRRI